MRACGYGNVVLGFGGVIATCHAPPFEGEGQFVAIDEMASLESSPLPASIARGLTDKLVERRKGAALELERSALNCECSHL